MLSPSLFLAAARYKLYVAVAMAAFASIYGDRLPREAPEAADAIAIAVLTAPAELPRELQGTALAATMAIYSVEESGVRKHPCLRSKSPLCADGGLAGGYWQLHQPAGFSDSARTQAEAWVELVRQSVRMCGTPQAALAMTLSGRCGKGRRETRTRLLLVERALSAWDATQTAGAPEAAAPLPAAAEPPAAGGPSDAQGTPARTFE